MPFSIESIQNGFVIKYKLDEYYNSNLKLFLQTIAQTNLLTNCSLVATSNEAYYCFSFYAESLCSLRNYIFGDNDRIFDSGSDSDSDSDRDSGRDSGSHSDSSSSSSSSSAISSCSFFTYNHSILFIGSMSTQLSALRRNKLSFFQLDLDSVFVINGNTFLMFNPAFVTPINNNGFMTFLSPIDVSSPFNCPEIANYSVLPFHCHSNCIYHCFASIIIYCMFDKLLPIVIEDTDVNGDDRDNGFTEEEEHNNDDLAEKEKAIQLRSERESILARLYGTKLYWFLLRCLEDYGPGRKLFYI
jgi:hypothetical protein